MAGKLTKQELKQPDKFQILLSQVMVYLTENRKKILMGAGGVVILVAIVGGWYLYHLNEAKNAQKSYERVFALPAGDDKAAVGIFKEVVAKYPGSHAATLANYRLGNLYFQQNDYAAAIASYETFLKQIPEKNDLRPLACMGLGFAYEAKKDYKNALAQFEKVTGTESGKVYETMNNRNIARVYEAMNDRAKALEYYRKALEKNKDPYFEVLIKRRIAALS